MPIQQGFTDSRDGTRLFYRDLTPEGEVKASAVISHGYAEHGGRYERLMRALAKAGYASFTPDHRGHGRSATTMGLVDSFDALVADLSLYREKAAQKHPGRPVFLVGHSMGGMATLHHVVRHAPAIAGAVVIAPAIEVPDDIPKIMISISKVLSRLVPKLAVQPFFNPAHLTSRPDVQQAVLTDPLFYRGKIRARTGAELYRAMVDINATMSRIESPLLLLHGDDDSIVKPRTSETVFAAAKSSDKARKTFPGRHEILNEACELEVIETIVAWLDERI